MGSDQTATSTNAKTVPCARDGPLETRSKALRSVLYEAPTERVANLAYARRMNCKNPDRVVPVGLDERVHRAVEYARRVEQGRTGLAVHQLGLHPEARMTIGDQDGVFEAL